MGGEWKDYDWQGMADCVRKNGARFRGGDFAALYCVFDSVQHLGFPPGYLNSLRQEMAAVLLEHSEDSSSPTCVYLTFFGVDDRASHMKIGVARDAKSRLGSIRTGNPIPHLWTFTTTFKSRQMAMRVERALLRHMSPDRAEGEWVNVSGLSEQAAEAVAGSLAEVARAISRVSGLTFTRAKI